MHIAHVCYVYRTHKQLNGFTYLYTLGFFYGDTVYFFIQFSFFFLMWLYLYVVLLKFLAFIGLFFLRRGYFHVFASSFHRSFIVLFPESSFRTETIKTSERTQSSSTAKSNIQTNEKCLNVFLLYGGLKAQI